MNVPSRGLGPEGLELVALGHARASGARELSTIVAVGNWGRGLMPLGAVWSATTGAREYDPAIFGDPSANQ